MKKQYRLPPGPKNYPVLGCFPLVDHKKPFATFCEWAQKYGKLFYCELGKDKVVILNDPILVKEIFGNELYQNRPQNPGVVKRKAESGGHCGKFLRYRLFFRSVFIPSFKQNFEVDLRVLAKRVALPALEQPKFPRILFAFLSKQTVEVIRKIIK